MMRCGRIENWLIGAALAIAVGCDESPPSPPPAPEIAIKTADMRRFNIPFMIDMSSGWGFSEIGQRPGVLFDARPTHRQTKAACGENAFIVALGDKRRTSGDPAADLVPLQAAFTTLMNREFKDVTLESLAGTTVDGAAAKSGVFGHKLKTGEPMQCRFYLVSHPDFSMTVAAHSQPEKFENMDAELKRLMTSLKWAKITSPEGIPGDAGQND